MKRKKLIALSSLILLAACAGCASFSQKQDQVYKRESGESLKFWKGVGEASSIHLPYAWAAVAAYQDSDDPARKPIVLQDNCPEPHRFLHDHGWKPWNTLPLLRKNDIQFDPESDAARKMKAVHLRVEVWANRDREEVIVAFGGTAATSLQDWKSNFRWLMKFFDDEDAYTVTEKYFVPAFDAEYENRSRKPENSWLKQAKIVAVGHSLGGGLAQKFAYSLSPKTGMAGVKTVYAFDPSPVSGKLSTEDYKKNAEGLTIYRIYNRGEILASVRSILQWADPKTKFEGQVWIDMRYKDGWTWRTVLPSGSVRAHGMYNLACFIKECAEKQC